MKILTIRLNDQDMKRIEAIRQGVNSQGISGPVLTINSTIRLALKQYTEYRNLFGHLSSLFTQEWKVNPEKLKKLNAEYGFMQTKFDF